MITQPVYGSPGIAQPFPGAGNGANIEADSNRRMALDAGAVTQCTALRVLTIRLDPDKEQRDQIRTAGRIAAKYCNRHMQAKLADALKWRTPDDAEKDSLVKYIRATERGDIGSQVYVGCEQMVTNIWRRDGKKIMAGASMPQWNEGNAIMIHGHKDRSHSGVQIITNGVDFAARIQLFRADYPAGNWFVIPLHRGKGNGRHDELLALMASGEVPIKNASLMVKRGSGKVLLRLVHPIEKTIFRPGSRHAQLSNFDMAAGDGTVERLLLRVVIGTDGVGRPDNQHIDYTSRLTHLKRLSANAAGLIRRQQHSRGRSRGQARDKRRFHDQAGFADFQRTYLQQWAHEMAEWLVSQGCGTLAISLVGGDWPAHMLQAFVEQKCEERGIQIVAASLDDPATEKAVKAKVRKEQTKARKLSKAVREIDHQLRTQG